VNFGTFIKRCNRFHLTTNKQQIRAILAAGSKSSHWMSGAIP